MQKFGLMHRLDVQTSGVMLCAKSFKGAYWMRKQWCSFDVTKEYVCLVHGWVQPNLSEVRKRIRETMNITRIVCDAGKPAYTEVATFSHSFRSSRGVMKARDEAKEERYS